MRRILPHITGLLCVIVVAITSVQLAAARGHAPAVGTMVICTGTGPLMILVDETGQPTGGAMVCPDYALAFYADLQTAAPEALRVDLWTGLWVALTESRSHGAPTPLSQPRGPPVAV